MVGTWELGSLRQNGALFGRKSFRQRDHEHDIFEGSPFAIMVQSGDARAHRFYAMCLTCIEPSGITSGGRLGRLEARSSLELKGFPLQELLEIIFYLTSSQDRDPLFSLPKQFASRVQGRRIETWSRWQMGHLCEDNHSLS